MVNAVWCMAVFSLTMRSNSSSLALCSSIGVQINPLPLVAIKLTISGVMQAAAQIKSPSFSRSSSSTTMITFPFLTSCNASSMVFNSMMISSEVVILLKLVECKLVVSKFKITQSYPDLRLDLTFELLNQNFIWLKSIKMHNKKN